MDRTTRPEASETAPPLERTVSPEIGRRLGLLLFISGYCSLVYQVAWFRLLRLIFGASTAANAAVVAIFMAGLGIGGVWIGRRVVKAANPMALYAKVEVGIALTAAASPILADLGRAIYLGLGGSAQLGEWGATIVRLILSTAVLGASTTLMGGTLPSATQALERESDQGRRWMAWLYGVNTLGAVTGALFATFISMEMLGIRRSIWLACAINLLLAVAARRLSEHPYFSGVQGSGDTDAATSSEVDGAPAPIVAKGRAGLSTRARFLLPAAGLVGFIFFLMELVWYRMLAPVLGGSSFTFGLILAVALAGIGLGSLIYAHGAEGRRPTLRALAVTCALEAFFLIAPFAAGDLMAFLAVATRPMVVAGFDGLVASWSLVVVLIVLPTAAVAGYQFPLLVALLGKGHKDVGYEVGLVYGWNTWGAILGSLAGGFGLMPLLSAPWLWRGSAVFLIVSAALILILEARLDSRPRAPALVPLGLIAAVLLMLAAPGPTAFWRHTAIGAGRVSPDFKGPNDFRNFLHTVSRGVVAEAEGVESAVALVRDNDLALIVNGKSDGSARGDAATNVMSAMIGTALHQEAKRILVIGLGTGVTAGWFAQIPSVEQVDVVELEPAVVRFADQMPAVTFDVLKSPKIRLIYGDGREWILTHSGQYDVIFSEPSNPYRVGVADLFSQDFYRSVVDRLAPGGIFLQWLQGYDVDPSVIQGCYATLRSVFPAIETWQVHAKDLLLVATIEPMAHDLDKVRDRVGRHPWDMALREVWGVDGLEGFYSGFVADGRLADALADASPLEVSTDDRPTIEFGFARNVGHSGVFDLSRIQGLAADLDARRPAVDPGAQARLDWPLIRELAEAREANAAFGAAGARKSGSSRNRDADQRLSKLSTIAQARAAARKAWASGDLTAAYDHWPQIDAAPDRPRCFLDRLMLAELRVAGAFDFQPEADRLTAEALEDLADPAPVETQLFRARLARRQGRVLDSADFLVDGLRRMRQDAWVHIPVVDRGFQLAKELASLDPRAGAQILDALAEPFAVKIFEEVRLATRVNLGGRLHLGPRCREIYVDYEPYPIWTERFLRARLQCYAQLTGSGDAQADELIDMAERDLETYLRQAPPKLADPDSIRGSMGGAP